MSSVLRRIATRTPVGRTPGTSTTTSTDVAVSRTSSGGRQSAVRPAAPRDVLFDLVEEAPGVVGKFGRGLAETGSSRR